MDELFTYVVDLKPQIRIGDLLIFMLNAIQSRTVFFIHCLYCAAIKRFTRLLHYQSHSFVDKHLKYVISSMLKALKS